MKKTKKTVAKTKAARAKAAKPFVLVRTYSAGVHFGTLESRSGQEVVLSGARRLWKWAGANTLHEIALRGVGTGSRISEAVESITLTQGIEIIPCTTQARANLDSARWQ